SIYSNPKSFVTSKKPSIFKIPGFCSLAQLLNRIALHPIFQSVLNMHEKKKIGNGLLPVEPQSN
ncbi:MAG: hypothetical protein SAK29_23690, partial [Scytonema sp. PMC 1069.18]|nr:hypothetical protein [Scytonema sp. PMC 1069.18]